VYVFDTASGAQLLGMPVLEISSPLGENQIAVHSVDSWSVFNMSTLAKQALPIEKQQKVEGFGAGDEVLIRDGDTIRVLNFRTGEITISPPIASLPPLDQYYFIQMSPDLARLAVVTDTTIRIIEFNDPVSTQTLEGHESPIGWVEFSEDSRLLMSTSLDTTCRIWDAQSGVLLSTINKVLRARFSPDKKQLVVHTEEGNLVRWDLPNRGEVASLSMGRPVTQAWFSEDGTKIFLSASAGETMTWEWQGSGLTLSPVTAAERSLPGTTAKDSPNGDFLALVDENYMLKIFDAGSQTLLSENRVSADRVNDLQFSPDSSMLILALGSPFVTDVQGDLGWLPFRTPGELEQTATIWDVPSMEQIAILRGSTNAVNSANFSPDSKYVVTASNDGFVRVYLARIADLELYARNRIMRNPPELTCEERVTFLKEKIVCPGSTLIP
jgi:WD40 repeat protein